MKSVKSGASLGIGLVLGSLLGGLTVAIATPPRETMVTPLGRSTVAEPFKIETTGPSDIVVVRATIGPGGDTGWHRHPGSEVAVVTAGVLTVYDGSDPKCTPRRFSAGQGRHQHPDTVHMGRNEGTTAVELYAAFVVPQGSEVRIDADRPGNCPE